MSNDAPESYKILMKPCEFCSIFHKASQKPNNPFFRRGYFRVILNDNYTQNSFMEFLNFSGLRVMRVYVDANPRVEITGGKLTERDADIRMMKEDIFRGENVISMPSRQSLECTCKIIFIDF